MQNFTVIKKNTKIQTKLKESFFTIYDGQTSVECDVTQSTHEEKDPNYVKTLWEGLLEGLPPNRPAGQKVDVTYAFNDSNIMECSFMDVASGKSETVQISVEAAKVDSNEDSALDDLLID